MSKKKKENNLVQVPKGISSSNRRFKIEEERLLYLALSRIDLTDATADNNFSDEKSRTIIIGASEIMQLYNGANRYTQLRESCRELNSKSSIDVYVDKNNWENMNVFSAFRYENGTLKVIFNKDIMPRLQLMKLGYSNFLLEDVYKVSSHFAVRILEFLLEKRNNKYMTSKDIIEREMTIEDLRKHFMMDGKNGPVKYKSTGNFIIRCIQGPVEQINKKTEYYVEYEKIKRGRNIVAIHFTLTISDTKKAELEGKTKKDDEQNLFSGSEFADKMCSLTGISTHTADELVFKYGMYKCQEALEYTLKQENVKDKAAYLVSVIKNGYSDTIKDIESVEKEKKTLFKIYLKQKGIQGIVATVIIGALEEGEMTDQIKSWLNNVDIDENLIMEAYKKNQIELLS